MRHGRSPGPEIRSSDSRTARSIPIRSISLIVNTRTPASRSSRRSPSSRRRSRRARRAWDRPPEAARRRSRIPPGETECRRERHAVDVPARARLRRVDVRVRVDPEHAARRRARTPDRRASRARPSGRRRGRAEAPLGRRLRHRAGDQARTCRGSRAGTARARRAVPSPRRRPSRRCPRLAPRTRAPTRRSSSPAYRIADGPMSTPRRPCPRSSVAPMIAISRFARRVTTPERYRASRGTLSRRGEVAQLVEHTAENRGVAGSSPALATLDAGSVAAMELAFLSAVEQARLVRSGRSRPPSSSSSTSSASSVSIPSSMHSSPSAGRRRWHVRRRIDASAEATRRFVASRSRSRTSRRRRASGRPTRRRAYANYVPDYDTAVVRRIREAGFVIVGKTNTPEFGTIAFTESDLNGATRNPWNPTSRPAGRAEAPQPPSLRASSHRARHGRRWLDSHPRLLLRALRAEAVAGPRFERTVRLSRGALDRRARWRAPSRTQPRLLDVLAGYEPGDPWWAPPPERPFAEDDAASRLDVFGSP